MKNFKFDNNGFFVDDIFYPYDKILSVSTVYNYNGIMEITKRFKSVMFIITFCNNKQLCIHTDKIIKPKYKKVKFLKYFTIHKIDQDVERWYNDIDNDEELTELGKPLEKIYYELIDRLNGRYKNE